MFSLPTVIAFIDRENRRKIQSIEYLRDVPERATFLFEPSVGKGAYFGGGAFSEDRIRWLSPLIESQPYVAGGDAPGFPPSEKNVRLWDGEDVDVDLSLFRKLPIDMSRGYLARYYAWAFPVHFDLSQPWLFVREPIRNDFVIVNRTFRYRNPGIDYGFLRKQGKVGFVGLPDEFEDFKRAVPHADWLECPNALELARLVAGCKAFVGGQSFAFCVAEALKVSRVLEVCVSCPNVVVSGRNGFDAVNQLGFESAVYMALNGA